MTSPDAVLSELYAILESRKSADPKSSYVASLYAKGVDGILKKVAEEAGETLIAAKDAAVSGKHDDLVYETADLWFHTLVMLSHFNLHPDVVLAELARRFNVSGHAEKAARTPTTPVNPSE